MGQLFGGGGFLKKNIIDPLGAKPPAPQTAPAPIIPTDGVNGEKAKQAELKSELEDQTRKSRGAASTLLGGYGGGNGGPVQTASNVLLGS